MAALNGPIAIRTARFSDLGEEQAQVIVNLGRGPHSRPGARHTIAVLDGNRRREIRNVIDIGPGEPL
jgi:hypothetical protein